MLSIYQCGTSQQSSETVIISKSVVENKNNLKINVPFTETFDETLLPMKLMYSIDKLNFQRSHWGQDFTLEWSFAEVTHFPVVSSATEIYSHFQTKGLTLFSPLSDSLSHCLSFSLSLHLSFFFLNGFKYMWVNISYWCPRRMFWIANQRTEITIYIKLVKKMYLLQYQPHPKNQKINTPSTSPKCLIFLLGKSAGWVKRVFSK